MERVGKCDQLRIIKDRCRFIKTYTMFLEISFCFGFIPIEIGFHVNPFFA